MRTVVHERRPVCHGLQILSREGYQEYISNCDGVARPDHTQLIDYMLFHGYSALEKGVFYAPYGDKKTYMEAQEMYKQAHKVVEV